MLSDKFSQKPKFALTAVNKVKDTEIKVIIIPTFFTKSPTALKLLLKIKLTGGKRKQSNSLMSGCL